MKNISSLIVALGLLFTAVNAPAKIIGRNDLNPVNSLGLNLPPPLARLVDAIGLMSMGCTGTHIGRGFVITAAHCLTLVDLPRIIENAPCSDVTIQWGVRGDRRGLTSRCLRVVAMQMNTISDWAIFQVDKAPAVAAEVETRAFPAPNQPLTALSHPEDQPLRWSKFCRRIQPVRAGDPTQMIIPTNPRVMYHQCDTMPGSSGAALIDARTFRIIAVHNGGDQNFNYATPTASMPWAQISARAAIYIRPLQ